MTTEARLFFRTLIYGLRILRFPFLPLEARTGLLPVLSNPLSWLFSGHWVVSSHCAEQYLLDYTKGILISSSSFCVPSSYQVIYSVNFWYLAYLDSYLHLLKLERFLNFPWVLSPCPEAWKLYPGSKLGKLQYSPHLFPCPQVLLSLITWCLMSWKILFYIFCLIFSCAGRKLNLVPIPPFDWKLTWYLHS